MSEVKVRALEPHGKSDGVMVMPGEEYMLNEAYANAGVMKGLLEIVVEGEAAASAPAPEPEPAPVAEVAPAVEEPAPKSKKK